MMKEKRGDYLKKDCRCHCGALLARRSPDGIELLCRRCKRLWLLPIKNFLWTESQFLSKSQRP